MGYPEILRTPATVRPPFQTLVQSEFTDLILPFKLHQNPREHTPLDYQILTECWKSYVN